ncbi:MAG: ABC transporter permease [Bacilli bacterium]|mgnify:CR=1 FL=1|nr:ABC transporter permease [Acholeplasmataceae bacterium]MDY2902975.1 ABC transporter permease [Bacilli bacterium]
MNRECKKIKKAYRFKKIKLIICQLLLLILFLTIWELLAYYNVINTFIFSKPSDIFKLLIKYIKTNEIFKHIKVSVIETILGIVIGSFVGIVIAIILWYFETLQKILKPFLNVLNALPKTALAPIMIIWAGTGMSGIVVVAISILLIITILSTYNFFINVDEEKIKMLKSFNAKRIQIFTKLIFPSNIGNICSVVKINIGMAWVGVIVGEFLVSKEGLGYLIMYGGQVFKLDLVMMGVLILSICAFIMHVLVEQIEKILLKGRE